jgi:hypothetical protein
MVQFGFCIKHVGDIRKCLLEAEKIGHE